jgi:Dolichyl-phosphate-mannose-protein mannosyltransferase
MKRSKEDAAESREMPVAYPERLRLPVWWSLVSTRGDSSLAAASVTLLGLIIGAISGALDINHDMAIAYTAALKLLSGQVLYVNFSEPHGPLSDWLFALFLELAPTGGWALVAASGLLNAAGTLVVWMITGRYPGPRDGRVTAAVITAFWFVPVFGCYYHDPLAFLFVLLGFLAYVRPTREIARDVLTGLWFALAFQTKQTVGVTGLLAFSVSLIYWRGLGAFRDRANYGILLAFLGFNAVVFAVIAACGGLGHYWLYSFKVPAEFGATHPNDKGPFGLVVTLLHPFRRPIDFQTPGSFIRHNFDVIVVLMYFAYYRLYRRVQQDRAMMKAGTLGERDVWPSYVFLFCLLATLWCSALLGRRTQEVTLGMGTVLAMSWSTLRRRVRYGLTAVVCSVALVYVYMLHGLYLAHDPFFETTDLRPIRVRPQHNQYDIASCKRVVEYLSDKPGRLAVIDEAAFLVPLALRRAPRGPSSYLTIGLSVPERPEWSARWQEEFIREIEDAGVEYVLQVTGYTYTDETRGKGRVICCLELPLLRSHVNSAFERVFAAGTYEVWKRKPRFEGGS